MSEKNGLIVLGLRAENVKGLKVVEISPDPTFQVVSGKNGAGKSTLIDSIWLALKGRAILDKIDNPIRDGEESAIIEVDLGEIRAIRKITKTGTTIEVRSKAGGKLNSPQKVLDALVGELSFDPLKFALMKPQERLKTLLDLIGVDPEPYDTKRNDLFEKRTIIGRDVKVFQGQVDGLIPYRCDGEMEKEQTANEIIKEYEQAQELKKQNDLCRKNYDDLIQEYKAGQATVQNIEKQIEELKSRLEKEKQNLESIMERGTAEREKTLALVDPDLESIKQRLDNVDDENKSIRKRNEYREAKKKLIDEQQKYDDMTAQIKAVEQEKREALEGATFPIEGLGINDSGVTYQNGEGKPHVAFNDISDGMKLKVSVGIAMALNPELRVIRLNNASLLDKENTKIIRELAEDKGYQVWAEVVDESGEVGVYIEDGEVKAK